MCRSHDYQLDMLTAIFIVLLLIDFAYLNLLLVYIILIIYTFSL